MREIYTSRQADQSGICEADGVERKISGEKRRERRRERRREESTRDIIVTRGIELSQSGERKAIYTHPPSAHLLSLSLSLSLSKGVPSFQPNFPSLCDPFHDFPFVSSLIIILFPSPSRNKRNKEKQYHGAWQPQRRCSLCPRSVFCVLFSHARYQ